MKQYKKPALSIQKLSGDSAILAVSGPINEKGDGVILSRDGNFYNWDEIDEEEIDLDVL